MNTLCTEPTSTTENYTQPSPEQIADIRKRLVEVSPDTLERFHHALRHETIDSGGSILYKAGFFFSSAELYEYRKTLFPPNSMVDAYAYGPPVLQRPDVEELRSEQPQTIDPEPAAPNREQSQQLREVRQGLVQLLAARTQSRAAEPDPVSGLALLSDLRDLINRYVILPEMAAEALALWVVHTYAFKLRQVTTYIGVVSPEKRCGKTTLLELLGFLAHEAVAAANISPSAVFRVIEEAQPTLIIDEADTFLQGRDEMAGILNAGYRKNNSYVVRVDESKARKQNRTPEPTASFATAPGLAKYSCWCPKVMAAIGRLPDTLADRCIIVTMQRKMPGEKCERLRKLNGAEIRQRCADFVRHHSDAIANAEPEIPAALNDRAADIWEPLLAIADLAGAEWPALARESALKLSGSVDDDITLIGYFLADIRTVMLNRKVDRILSRHIVTTFNPMHTRPWQDLRRGREINEYWLATKMRELGIRPKYIRFRDSTGRGYTLEDVESAFRRYVPSPDGHTLSKPEPPSHDQSD